MHRRIALALLAIGLGLPLGAAAQSPISGLQPANPQPAPDQLAPGLAVNYAYGKIKHLKEFNDKGKHIGAPLTHLTWSTGAGTVLTSRETDGVQAHIVGFIRFPVAGIWTFQVNSNDGVRLEIGGKQIWEDPDVHPDRLSPPIPVQVPSPGLYPIRILYFERTTNSTLEVFRTPPGGQRGEISGDAIVHLRR
jgi:hypothetical protein